MQPNKDAVVLKVGENLTLGGAEVLTGEFVAGYIHSNGKLASVVVFNKACEADLANDIAMHVVAMAPTSLNPEDVDVREPVERERRPDRVPAEPLQSLPVVLVDPHPGVEREAVEGHRVAGVLERVREPDPSVHLGRLQLGESVLLDGPLHLPVPGDVVRHLPDDPGQDPLQLPVARRRQPDEQGPPGAGQVEDAIRDQGMEVHVQVDGRSEPLDRGTAAGPRIGHPDQPPAPPLPGKDGPGEEVEQA